MVATVKNQLSRVRQLFTPVRGQALVEYALILALLAMALAFAVAATGPAIGNVFCNVVDNLAGEESADICGRGTIDLNIQGGAPNDFWQTVTWVADNPQGETPFPTPISQPPTNSVSVFNTLTHTPTHTQTLTPSHTPTFTPTSTSTVGPSATPDDRAFTVPHVDQVANPEWWRLSGGFWLGQSSADIWNAQWYDNADFANTPPTLSSPRNALVYTDSDLNFNWGSGRPTNAGLSADDTFGAIFTRIVTIGATETLVFTLGTGANDYIRLRIDGTTVLTGAGSITQVLTAGTHTFEVRYAELNNDASMSFTVSRTRVNPNDSVANCPWGRVNNAADSASPAFNFDNTVTGGAWAPGATCNLELRGYVDINLVTNPVLSFWDVWDFVSAPGTTASLQVAEYITDVGGFFDRVNATWTNIALHSTGTSNYNWTRYEVPIGSYGGTSGRVTFRFQLTSNGGTPFNWYIDDLQVKSQVVSPGIFTVGKFWDLNNRSQMTDFIFDADSNKTLEDNPALPQTSQGWRWDLDTTNARSGTAFTDSPSGLYTDHSEGGERVYALELARLVDLNGAPAADTEADTGNPLLSFWFAYDVPLGSSVTVEYTRDARDTTPDVWTAIPDGGRLLGVAVPVGAPGTNEQLVRTNLTSQYYAVNLNMIPNYLTQPFRLRFALRVSGTATVFGDGVFIDDIYLEREGISPYFAYPFSDDAENPNALNSYWRNVGAAWGRGNVAALQPFAPTAAQLTPGAERTGYYYTDSPGGNYTNNVTRILELKSIIDLVNDTVANISDPPARPVASEPILSFWFARDVNVDTSIAVDVWTSASNTWTQVWLYDSDVHATSFRRQDAWERVEVNLRSALEVITGSTWAMLASNGVLDDDDIKIRFTFVSGASVGDGVYIDQIRIANNARPTHDLWSTASGGDGFYEEYFESVISSAAGFSWQDRWYTGGIWSATNAKTHTGNLALDVGPNAAEYMRFSDQLVELVPTINLTSTPVSEPVYLYFWMTYDIGTTAFSNYIRAQVAVQNNASTTQSYDKLAGYDAWTDLTYTIGGQQNTTGVTNNIRIDTWGRAAVNLNAYRGKNIRLRFAVENPTGDNDRDIYIDDVTFVYGARNIATPLVDDASTLNNWVAEGTWGLTPEYFTGSGSASLDLNGWTGWFYDCEGLSLPGCNAGNWNTLLTTTYPTNPPTGAPTNLSTNAPVGPQTSPTLDFFYDYTLRPTVGGSPLGATFDDTWAARWVTGDVVLQGSTTYSVKTISDDGIRMFISNAAGTNVPVSTRLLINNWSDHPATENSFSFNVTSTTPITRRFIVEYYENSGGATTWAAITNNTFSYSDSPNTPAGSNWTVVKSPIYGDYSLILNGFVNLASSATPRLAYSRLYDLTAQSLFSVEVSINGGFTWTTIASENISNATRVFTQGWEDRNVNLATPAANQANVMIRFRMDTRTATNTGLVNNGIWVTDIQIIP